MTVNWTEVQSTIIPIKSYEDLCQRWRVSFSYPFVRRVFNATMPALMEYTRLGVGSDPRQRYTEYCKDLIHCFSALQEAGVEDILDLLSRVEERPLLEAFSEQSGLEAVEITRTMKYLVFWFIPMSKYLSGLIQLDSELHAAIKVLIGQGIRTNLDLLEAGNSPQKRKNLSKGSGLPPSMIDSLVNRADLSRMPWASKATTSNIIGAGYGSLRLLANADPEKLTQDYLSYGKSIGKNLRLGNEIENSHRFAKILPIILQD